MTVIPGENGCQNGFFIKETQGLRGSFMKTVWEKINAQFFF